LYSNRNQSLEQFWYEQLSDRSSAEYPNIKKIAVILLILFLNSVACERGFSTQNRLKGALRNKMSIQLLDWLMRVVELGPEVSDQADVSGLVEETYQLWANLKKRNPYKGNPDKSRQMKQKANKLNIHDYLEHLGDFGDVDSGGSGGEGSDSDEEEVASGDLAVPEGAEGEGAEGEGAMAAEESGQMSADANGLCGHVTWDAALIPDGYHVMLKPPAVMPRLIRKALVATRQGDKWWLGVGKEKLYHGKYKHQYRVKYSHENQQAHPLLLTDYGVSKWWVILEKK
jgi:hypothetical protein